MRLPKVVSKTPVATGTKRLMVSTVRIKRGYYDTGVFDDSSDKRHAGMLLAGFVIDKSSMRAQTREAAMENHREAVYGARTEEPQGGAR